MARHKDSEENPGFKREFPGQHPGEEVALVFRQHPVVLRKPLIYGLLILVVSILPLDFIFSGPLYATLAKLPFIALLIIGLYWFYHWVGWYYSLYIVTDQRLIDIRQKGFFNRRVKEVGFNKVQSINYHIKGIQAAILKFGDITVETFAEPWVLTNIHHPEEVHEAMMAASRRVAAIQSPSTQQRK